MFKRLIDNIGNKNVKATIVVTIVVILLIIVLFCVFFSDGAKFAREYERFNNKIVKDNKKYPYVDIDSGNIMKYSNLNEILKLFDNDESGVIYFGYPECLYCRSAVQILCEVSEETKLDRIYYLNVENQDDDYLELYDKLGEELVDNIDGNPKIEAPLVVFLVDGKIISYNKGTLYSHDYAYDMLDESQVEGLSKIYRMGIKDVLNSKR